MIHSYLPNPTLCIAILLPPLRSSFPASYFAQALLQIQAPNDLNKAEESKLPLIKWIVGQTNKPIDLFQVGELAAWCFKLQTPSWSFPENGTEWEHSAIASLSEVLREAAGWAPINVAYVLSGYGSGLELDSVQFAHFFAATFPNLRVYEESHGDMGLMLVQMQAATLRKVPDSYYVFLKTLLSHYPIEDATNIAIFLDSSYNLRNLLGPRTPCLPDSESTDERRYKMTAIRAGSAPLHVSLAYTLVKDCKLATSALSFFRITYEAPLMKCAEFKMSCRLNDWRLFDTPRDAMAKIAARIATFSEREIKSVESHAIETLLKHILDFDFGFLEPNEVDKTEAIQQIDIENDLGDIAVAVDAEESNNEDASIDLNAASFQLDDDYLEFCIHQLDMADGDVNQVDLESLVDELIKRGG
jgi:hypothetical protein